MRFEDADDGPVDVFHPQPEQTVALVLARQDPASAVRFPDTVGYPFPRTPFGDVLLCVGHRVKRHANAWWLLGGRGEVGRRSILGWGL